MTGFEVVGLLLALYPVLIDGIRLYQNVKSGQLLSDLLKDVLQEQIIFHDWIGHLLRRSVPVTELQDLLDPNSRMFARWDDPRLHQAIEESYGTLKASFLLETLKDAHEELNGIKTDLSTLRPSTDNFRTRVTTTFRSVRHSREGSHTRERLRRLQKLNTRLGQVCQTSNLLRPLAPGHQGFAPIKFHVTLPDHASRIHQAIQNGYRCHCNEPHLTKLCLPMTLESKATVPIQKTKPYFELLFSIQDEDDQRVAEYEPASLDDSTLSMMLSNTSIGSPYSDTDSQNQSPSASTATLTRRDSLFSKMNSNVSTNSSVGKLTLVKSCSFNITEGGATPAKEIVDICSAVKRNDGRQEGHGASLNLGALPALGHVGYELQASIDSQITAASTMTSLEDIFIGNDLRLARGHRIALALRLSAAIVQFSSTPWIKSQWLWEDFSILDLHNRRLEDLRLYVAHQFYSSRHARTQPANWPNSLLAIVPGEQALIRLGCALVELAFGKRLASMEAPWLKSNDPGTRDMMMAHSIVQSGRLRDEESEVYAQVVRTCLKQEVPQVHGWKSLNRNDPSFQEDAMRAIVEPLHQIWKRDWGISGVDTRC